MQFISLNDSKIMYIPIWYILSTIIYYHCISLYYENFAFSIINLYGISIKLNFYETQWDLRSVSSYYSTAKVTTKGGGGGRHAPASASDEDSYGALLGHSGYQIQVTRNCISSIPVAFPTFHSNFPGEPHLPLPPPGCSTLNLPCIKLSSTVPAGSKNLFLS